MDHQATISEQAGTGKIACNEAWTDTSLAMDQMAIELKEPTVISPKEWHYLHNQWLHGIMWAAMGDKAHPDIPNLAEYKYTPHVAPDYKIEVVPP